MVDHSFILSCILIAVSALGYVNERYIGLQRHIFMTVSTLAVTAVLLTFNHYFHHEGLIWLQHSLGNFDFRKILLQGMLSFLLFAGGMSIDYKSFKRFAKEIFSLAFICTTVSTLLIGSIIYLLDVWLGGPLDAWLCYLFGALISPTDPIAVLAMLKNFELPESMTIKLAGESLFNDGVGIVIFMTIIHCMQSTGEGSALLEFVKFFCQSTLGGVAYGLALGYIAQAAILKNRDVHYAMLVTLTVPIAGYTFAEYLHVSGPLAMVVSGLIVGHRTRSKLYNELIEDRLKVFWHFIDEFFNLILFLLIGLESVIIHWSPMMWGYTLVAIFVVLLSRWLSVAGTLRLVKFRIMIPKNTDIILLWGGLRGGLAVALALSLPNLDGTDTVLAMTYGVVIFSVIFQGLTLKPLANRLLKLNTRS